MHRLWLIFAQAVTISVAALFVISSLRPDWLAVEPQVDAPTIVELRNAGAPGRRPRGPRIVRRRSGAGTAVGGLHRHQQGHPLAA